MSTIVNSFYYIRVLLSIAALAGLLNSSPVTATDPDFSNNEDILEGLRSMLPVDDLVVTTASPNKGAPGNSRVFNTNDSKIVTPDVTHAVDDALPFTATVARMFDLPRDVVITITSNSVNLRDDAHGGVTINQTSISGFPIGSVAADFTGNGFSEVAYLSANKPDGTTGGVVRIIAPNNVTSIDDGLFISDGDGPVDLDFSTMLSITAGDFNGDGKVEVAIANTDSSKSGNFRIFIFEVLTTGNGGLANPALSEVARVKFSSPANNISDFTLLAGDYDGLINANGRSDDELVLVLSDKSINPVGFNALSFEVCPPDQSVPPTPCTFAITEKSTLNLSTGDLGEFFNTTSATSGRLDWFSSSEQLVVALWNTDTGPSPFIFIITLDQDLKFSIESKSEDAIIQGTEVAGMALGQFDQDLGSDPDTGAFKKVPNLQLALLMRKANTSQLSLGIFNIFPKQNFRFDGLPASVVNFQTDLGDGTFKRNSVGLAVGDTQGRSLLLGPAQIVRVTKHKQPDLILGAPPMHVDYITPANESTPEVFNFSSVPDEFHSAYDTQDKTSSQSSHKSTVGYTFGFTETVEGSVTAGVPDIADVKSSFKASAQQTFNNKTAKKFNTYAGQAFNASTQTGFGDQLVYMQRRFNLYIYPVLGHTTCPHDKTCPPDQEQPLNLIFSGPDMISRVNQNTRTVEWYQVEHEPGNVLSFPANQMLLTLARQQTNPNFSINGKTLLGADNFFTDSSDQQVNMAWMMGTSQNVSVASSSNYSFDESTSVSASGTLADIGIGTSGKATFSANKSTALSSLKTTTESVGASTGVTINKPGTFANPPVYQYEVDSFIFGQPDPPGTVQKIQKSKDVDLQTNGPLEVGFTANPLSSGAGSWWETSGNYQSFPDLALSHPVRWDFVEQAATDPVPANCLLASADEMDCLTFNVPPDFTDPTDCPDLDCLWSSEFHWMRGLLIGPADATGGSQITQATAGDTLRLKARVYNFSLQGEQAGTSVHARFYRQQWQPVCPSGSAANCRTNTPIGDSVLIEEVKTGAIAPFNEQTLNWQLLEATFDTTGSDDKYFIFWVVVWMQDSNGDLLSELPAHGLTKLPGTLTSIADVPIESHSNNVGYYHMPFYIFPKQTSTVSLTDSSDLENTGLLIESVKISDELVIVNEKTEISVLLRAGNKSENGLLVLFSDVATSYYDESIDSIDANFDKGKIFDAELVSHIRANDIYQIRVPYRPTECGEHELFVVIADGKDFPLTESIHLDVPCEQLLLTGLKGQARRVASDKDNAAVELSARFSFSGQIDLSATVIRLDSLLAEAGSKLLTDSKGNSLFPLELHARPDGKVNRATFLNISKKPSKVRVRFKLHDKQLDMTLRVDRAMIPKAPKQCKGDPLTTILTTQLRLEDGINKPIDIEISAPWRCITNRKGTIKKLRLSRRR